MRFEKWQALGNDYVIVEAAALPFELTPERVKRICDPHFGVGSDGVLLLTPVEDPEHVAELRIFNPDGSEAELSGNGAREAVLYLRAAGWTQESRFSVITKAGPVRPVITGPNEVRMEIGRGRDEGGGTLTSAGREWSYRRLNVGNPQCVVAVDDELEDLDLGEVGPGIESNTELFPERTNVSFTRVEGSTVRARIFERGVGETLSSGTGASGAAVAAFLEGAPSPITVQLDGGELTVEITPDLEMTLIGTAEPICRGELSDEFLSALRRLG
ncbi:MAG: diaminopimelate epimerase [Solirubrobacterales bacterium]|nr:diaminopimelate epimerase [Solirubrobacterales bacterium]